MAENPQINLEGPEGTGNPVDLEAFVGVIPSSRVYINDTISFALEAGIKWGYVSGVEPQTFALPIIRPQAEKLVQQLKGDVKLTMYAPDGRLEVQKREFEKLWLNLRSPHGYEKDALLLQDRRWTWGRPKVTKAFNLTRRSNDILTFEGILPEFIENALVEAKNYFVETTVLPDPDTGEPLRPYTATDIVVEILRDVLGYSEDQIQVGGAASTRFVPMNQFIVGENANTVIARYLSMGGNDLYIDEKGSVVIYDRTQPFDESDFFALFSNGFPQFIGGTGLYIVDYKAIRPYEIETQHPVEAEVLFTHEEGDLQSTTSGEGPAETFEEGLDQLKKGQVFVRNVTRTIVPNQVDNLPRGSVVTLEDAITAYGNLISAPRNLTLDDLRQAYGDDNAEMLGAFSGSSVTASFVINATNIYQQLVTDFRSLFQVPDVVMKQLLKLKNTMVDVINAESQTRSPSEVFSTISWLLNEAFLFAVQENPSGVVLNSFSEDPYVPIPAKVTIEDEDLGLVRINWLGDLDRVGTVVKSFPGVALADMYSDELGEGRAAASQGSYHHGVEADWECSFVLSIIPFPNNDPNGKRNYSQTFKATEFGEDGDGPRLTTYVGYDSARFRLPDSLLQYITPERRNGEDVFVDDERASEMGVSGPMVNYQIIRAIGYAEAKRIYETFNNQLEGDAVFGWDRFWTESVRPRASMRNIIYGMSKDGQATVSIKAQRLTSPKDILNVLPRSVLDATGRTLRFNGLQGG